MRRFLIIAAMFAAPALGQSEFLKGAELQAEVEKLCAEGCIVFSPAEVEALQKALMEKAVADMLRVYDEGKALGLKTCRNYIVYRDAQ
jgi:hypothetical protein